MLCLRFRAFAENSFREWSERECRYLVGLVRAGQIQVQWISLGVGWGEPAGDRADMLSLESIMEGRSSVKTQIPFQNLEEKASELAELENCRVRPR